MRYFIISFDSKNLAQIQAVIFGDISNQRKSLDGKYFVAALNEGDKNNYDFLNPFLEFNEESMKKEMEEASWKPKAFL